MSLSLDMSSILLQAYELADMIDRSYEVQEFLKYRERLHEDQDAQVLIHLFNQKKEEFAEVERFGWFHPDYQEKYAEIQQLKKQVDAQPTVKAYKEAEDRLDKMLYHVSRTIARSVSHAIKVPRNASDAELKGAGCGGGACGGNCGGKSGCGNNP